MNLRRRRRSESDRAAGTDTDPEHHEARTGLDRFRAPDRPASTHDRGDGASEAGTPAEVASGAPPPPGSRFAQTFVSLRERDFRYLMISTLTEFFGFWGHQIGIAWLVYVLTDSAVQLGAVAFVQGVAGLVLTPFGGIIADRYPRRAVIVWATIFGAAQSVLLAFLVIAGLVEVWHAYAFSLLFAVMMAVNHPARQAYVFDITTDETLTNAVAMNSIAQNLSRIAGPSLASALIVPFGTAAPFVFVTVVRLVSAVATVQMSRRSRQTRGGTGRNPLREIWEGFAYLGSDNRLVGLLLVNAVPAVVIYPYVQFFPIFATDVLNAGPGAYGLLASMIGVGSLIGLLLLAALGDIRNKGRYMLGTFLVYLVLVLTFTQSTVLLLSLALLAIAGIFHGLAMALNTTLFQLALRNDMRGRGMSAWQMGLNAVPLGALPMGFAVSSLGPQWGVGVFVVACLAIFVAMTIFWRSLRVM